VFSRTIYLTLFLLFALVGCSQNSVPLAETKEKPKFDQEDEYILYAIEYTNQGQYDMSRDLYFQLFEKTKKYEYLLRSVRFSLEIKDFEFAKIHSQNNLNKEVKEYEELYRVYIVALINLHQYDDALKHSKILLQQFNNILNTELLGNVYYMRKDFYEAANYFESAYSVNGNPNTLLNLVNILYAFTNEKQKAISYLETHIRLKSCDIAVCAKLLSIYEEQQNIDGVISILKRMYSKFKEEQDLKSMLKVYTILIDYLEQKDINLAIKFLEENRIDDMKLVALYKRANRIEKALELVKNEYKINKNLDVLAQIAILEFEVAPNKTEVLPSVIQKFEDVLAVLDNHIYQNYLGYILIDYDIDVPKGLDLVRKALEKAPNNLAYMDSLAWGLYKQNSCQEALKYMEKIVNAIGLNDNEIKHHWEKIQECSAK
jgi:tetratricopeptide (TPR) repeat protein